MKISLVGDMIDVSDEELEAIGYVAGKKPSRAVVVEYLKEEWSSLMATIVDDYLITKRLTKIAALKAEAAAKLEEAKRLEESDG